MRTNLRETVSCYFSRNKNQTCALSTKNFLIESVSDDNDVIKGAVVLGWGRQISENLGLTIGIKARTIITCH